jgi:hypothetical protein
MRNVSFPSLQNLDVETLEEITLIQASRKTTGWQATTTQGSSVCVCKGSCVSSWCKCKKAERVLKNAVPEGVIFFSLGIQQRKMSF